VPTVDLDEPTDERACNTEHVSRESGDLANADEWSRRRAPRTLGSEGMCRGTRWFALALALVLALAGCLRPRVEMRGAVQAAGRSGVRNEAPVVITFREGGYVGQLVGPRPVDQRFEDGADADALLDGNGFDPCAPIVIESQA
jgi:hypothetical protein